MAAALISRLDQFDCRNGDFDYYLEQFDHFLVLNSIDEESKKVPLFITSIGQDAYKILKQICNPVDPKEKSFDELKVQLLEYFFRRDFYARNQRPGEYTGAYVNELKRLSLKCNFGPFAKEAIRDRTACGKLPEDKGDNKTPAPRASAKASTAEKNVKVNEVAQPQQKKPKQPPQHHPASIAQELGMLLLEEAKKVKGPTKQGQQPQQQQQQNQNQHKCKICGHPHKENQCPHKDASCHKCRKKGHIALVCREKANNKGPQEQQQPVQVHVHVQQNSAMKN